MFSSPFAILIARFYIFKINLSKKLQHSSRASLSAPCSSTASECPSFISPHCLWADCVQLLDRNEINKSTFFYYIFQNLKHGAINTGTFFFLTLQCLILWYTHCARCRQAVTTIAPLMCEHVDIIQYSDIIQNFYFYFWPVSAKLFHYSHTQTQSHIPRATNKNPPTADLSLLYTTKPTMNLLTGVFPDFHPIVPLSRIKSVCALGHTRTSRSRQKVVVH